MQLAQIRSTGHVPKVQKTSPCDVSEAPPLPPLHTLACTQVVVYVDGSGMLDYAEGIEKIPAGVKILAVRARDGRVIETYTALLAEMVALRAEAREILRKWEV